MLYNFLMYLIAWNCRGLSKNSTMDRCREFIRNHNSFLILLFETRSSTISGPNFARRLGYHWRSSEISSLGFSGGILLLWNSNKVQVTTFIHSRQAIDAVISIDGFFPWILSGVYASPSYLIRKSLWTELASLVSINAPHFIVGDLNVTLSKEDKLGGKPFAINPGIRDF